MPPCRHRNKDFPQRQSLYPKNAFKKGASVTLLEKRAIVTDYTHYNESN